MTVAYSVIRFLTNGSDQAVASVELTTPNKTAAIAKYHEILADAAIKAGSGRLADGALQTEHLSLSIMVVCKSRRCSLLPKRLRND